MGKLTLIDASGSGSTVQCLAVAIDILYIARAIIVLTFISFSNIHPVSEWTIYTIVEYPTPDILTSSNCPIMTSSMTSFVIIGTQIGSLNVTIDIGVVSNIHDVTKSFTL